MGDSVGRFLGPDVLQAQRAVCARYGVEHYPTRADLKVGISLHGDAFPINGMRVPLDPEYDALAGWRIWNGERSGAFEEPRFEALHATHLADACPDVLPYLGLPPRWRFLIAPDYEDVWQDSGLLDPPPLAGQDEEARPGAVACTTLASSHERPA